MVSIEDVTERESVRRDLLDSQNYAFGLFAHSPVSLWVEDFSGVKRLIDDVRNRGIEDFRVFTDVHEEFVSRCMSEIHVIDVNSRTLQLFGADDKKTLLHNLPKIFRDEMGPPFREQLIDLWDGKLFQQREVVNYALDGTKVQVALTDITARKKAETYLEYLGTHDVLTRTLNRSFYVDELNRLERKGPLPITVIVADLNGLKATNDELGHAAGDTLLRRAGEVFESLVEKPASVSRIGGDEFAVLLPGADAMVGEVVLASLKELIEINNQFYPDVPLSISTGIATSRPGDRLEQVVKRADMKMLHAKRMYHLRSSGNRRKASVA
jgi:diguanylate cyclase (GGDEF)-like protein